MWTQFTDMHSGGDLKEGRYQNIYIEAPAAEAKVIFYNRFGHNPDRVTCTCCGNDYGIYEFATLEQATALYRGCSYDDKAHQYVESGGDRKYGYHKYRRKYGYHKYRPLDQYLKEELEAVLLIPASEIKSDERAGTIPEQGYVWID